MCLVVSFRILSHSYYYFIIDFYNICSLIHSYLEDSTLQYLSHFKKYSTQKTVPSSFYLIIFYTIVVIFFENKSSSLLNIMFHFLIILFRKTFFFPKKLQSWVLRVSFRIPLNHPSCIFFIEVPFISVWSIPHIALLKKIKSGGFSFLLFYFILSLFHPI